MLHKWVSMAVSEVQTLTVTTEDEQKDATQKDITGVVERTVPMLCMCLHEIASGIMSLRGIRYGSREAVADICGTL